MAMRSEVQEAISAFNDYKLNLEVYQKNGDGWPTDVNTSLATFKKKLAQCTQAERNILRTQLV